MDFLTPYGQADHPSHHYGRGEHDYPPPPVKQSSYSYPPVDTTYGNGGPYGAPPSSYRDTYDQPPPRGYNSKPSPYVGDTYDQAPRGYNSKPAPYAEYQNYPPPPPPSSYGGHEETNPHMPVFIEGPAQNYPKPNYNTGNNNYVSNGVGLGGPPKMGYQANKPSYRICCKAGGDRFAVAIRDGKVILTRPNSTDPTQHWYKDEKHSTKVKDEERHPSFILVNKATGQAVKHSVSGYPVQLVAYNPDAFDVSIMWTESRDLGSGFRTVRTVNNVGMVMDAWNADKNHGGIRDGTVVALYKCWKGDNQNQQWKLTPY